MKVYSNGKEIQRGDKIKDFRGGEATFLYISRLPIPGTSGNVTVMLDDCGIAEYYFVVYGIELLE